MTQLRSIQCPGCRATYRVDPGKVPSGGGQLTCPACGRRWRVAPSNNLEAPSPPPPTALASPPAPASASAPAAARAPGEVECPRCGHHFGVAGTGAGVKKSVLVVDDQEFFRNFAVDLLGDRYQMHVAKSAEEALRKADEVSPDLIVLDLGLDQGPEDGRRILETLARRVPVVIMTGRMDFDLYGKDWHDLVALGAHELVIKSMTIGEELRTKVAKVIGV